MLNQTIDYRTSVYAPIREFQGKMNFTYKGVTTTYLDDKIISMNTIEEMNNINNTLPSNEINIVMDNTSGDFSFLTYDKMYEIIASKPKIEAFLGLVTANVEAQTLTTNYVGKIINSTIENPNIYKRTGSPTFLPPSSFSFIPTQTDHNEISILDGVVDQESQVTLLRYPLMLHQFDVVQVLERQFGTSIWGGKTLLADKVALAKTYIKDYTYNCTCRGNSPTGNKASINRWVASSSAWFGTPVSHTNSTLTKLTIARTDASTTIDANGFMNFLAYAEPTNNTISSNIYVDYVELILNVNPILNVEWIPIGVFNLINYKTQTGNMSIQLTGRDSLDLLRDISYDNTQQNTLYNLAVDIFTQANITSYSIDDSLKNISGSFSERLDMRTALQHIGIASRAAVYQDRTGRMVIKPFTLLDQSSNYLTYSGQSQLISGNTTSLGTGGGWAYPINSTGGGMKYISMDYQYTEPDVQLQKSVYELIITVNSGQGNAQERRYVNTVLGGNNGASMQIDNPLIETNAVADAVAEWYIRETNYGAVYNINWRQNPVLECGDIVLIEDSFGANKQTRITHQEFMYTGYLEGRTESRGGI